MLLCASKKQKKTPIGFGIYAAVRNGRYYDHCVVAHWCNHAMRYNWLITRSYFCWRRWCTFLSHHGLGTFSCGNTAHAKWCECCRGRPKYVHGGIARQATRRQWAGNTSGPTLKGQIWPLPNCSIKCYLEQKRWVLMCTLWVIGCVSHGGTVWGRGRGKFKTTFWLDKTCMG